MRILSVEDEPAIIKLIKNKLQHSGNIVDVVYDGLEAMNKIDAYDYDVIILDIMLPGADGYEICKHIRKLGLNTKILMLTAKEDVESKVKCLNMGADDYMTKPFSLDELEARVRALSRREKLVRGTIVTSGPVSIDTSNKKVMVNGKTVRLALTEFRLLEYLIRNKNSLCTRTMLEENIWGNKGTISNVMNATISKLRSKIKKLNDGKDIIKTIPRSGYMID